MRITAFLKELSDDRSGATAIEYGLIAALIVIAMVGTLGQVADGNIALWNKVENKMTTATANV